MDLVLSLVLFLQLQLLLPVIVRSSQEAVGSFLPA